MFVTDTFHFDLRLFESYLAGQPSTEVAAKRAASSTSSLNTTGATNVRMWLSQIEDEYRSFQLLAKSCRLPVRPLAEDSTVESMSLSDLTADMVAANAPAVVLESQSLVLRLSPSDAQAARVIFYRLHQNVVRQLLGKKLKPALRRDLDEVAERASVPLTVARRNFDNLKRLEKALGDRPHSEAHMAIVDFFEKHFALPPSLGQLYEDVLFLGYHRFDIANKKRLAPFLLTDFLLAVAAMKNWTAAAGIRAEFDVYFTTSLSALRGLLPSDKRLTSTYRALVRSHFPPPTSTYATQLTGPKFNTLLKSLVSLGDDLRDDDRRDFFVQLVDRFVEPLRSLAPSLSAWAAFFTALDAAFRRLVLTEAGRTCRQPGALSTAVPAWSRFMIGLGTIVVQFGQRLGVPP